MLKKFSVENFKGFQNKITFDIGSPSNYNFNSEIIKIGGNEYAKFKFKRWINY